MGIDRKTIDLAEAMCIHNPNLMKINIEESKEFITSIGMRQGCMLSPVLCSIVVDEFIKRTKKKMKTLNLEYRKME